MGRSDDHAVSQSLTAVLQKRSLVIAGHATSVALEPEFWSALERFAEHDGVSLPSLIAGIDETRSGSLSSALRVYTVTRLSGTL